MRDQMYRAFLGVMPKDEVKTSTLPELAMLLGMAEEDATGPPIGGEAEAQDGYQDFLPGAKIIRQTEGPENGPRLLAVM